MIARVALLALLVGCPPKPAPPAAGGAEATPAPAAPTAPAPTTPAPAPAEPAPAAPPATSSEGTATAPATPAEPPAIAVPKKDALARQVNDAATLLTANEPERAQRAIDILKGQLADNPDSAAIHYNLGVAYEILGQEAEARKAWTRATEVDPTFPKAWQNLGVLNARSGRVDLALASFQAGSRYAPNNVDLRVASIGALRQLRRYDDAIAEAKTALAINSKAIAIYTELALVYIDTGQYDLARFSLQKAMNDIPGAKDNARVNAVLGEIFYRLGYIGDAVQSYQKSLSLDPNQLPALLYLSGYYMDNRAWTDARPLLERAAQLQPNDAGIQLNLGICYRGEGRWEDAKKAYIHALELQPSNPEPHRNLAVLYGDYQKAYDAALQSIEDYRRAGGGTPQELDAWVASIKKEQKRAEDKRKREEERKKKEQLEKNPDGGLFGPDGAPAPADGTAPPAGGSPAPDGSTPAPAPAPDSGTQPAPAPAPTPEPAPAPAPAPEPAPAPPSDGGADPWGN